MAGLPEQACPSVVAFLTAPEIDALVQGPDRTGWTGRRDHALLVLALQTGLRVSELTGLDCGDISLGAGGNVRACARAASTAPSR